MTHSRSTVPASPGRRSSRALAGIALLCLLVLPLVLPGCGRAPSPLAPEPGPAPSLQAAGVGDFSTDGLLAFLQTPDLSLSRSAGKLISAAQGGSVELAGFRVEIPAGALAHDTYVTIDLPHSLPEANYVVADFGPSGTQFSRPVTITLPLQGVNLDGTDLSSIKVGYWSGSEWENYGGSATSSSVSATTGHFSTYGARTYKGGIDTTSGG